MSRALPLLAALATLTASACVPAAPPLAPAALRASLEKAELDFAAAVAARGVDAWVDAFAADGMELGADGSVARGHAAIRATMAPALAKVKITWRPAVVEVAASGDMGFTSGPYEVTATTPAGAPSVVARGTYLTVWKRGPDGTWKALADLGSEAKSKP